MHFHYYWEKKQLPEQVSGWQEPLTAQCAASALSVPVLSSQKWVWSSCATGWFPDWQLRWWKATIGFPGISHKAEQKEDALQGTSQHVCPIISAQRLTVA